jgi:two-component sensor histidine kinase
MNTINPGISRESREDDFPPGGGEMGALVRALDWSKTGLGPISAWPTHLKATISLMLPAQAQIVLFSALHETATNAVKYGALSEPNGAIHIKWETQGDDFHLEWEETGGPTIVIPPKAQGFGSVLTERSIASQLGGKIEYDWQRNGLKLRMTIPLDRLSV